jgi:Uma2 family endonuclease
MIEAPVMTIPPVVKRPDRLTEIYYPESDGKPVGETDFHVAALFYLWQALRYFYRYNPNVYVAGNMLFYYEEGNPAEFKVPDVFVVKGIAKHDRRVYKLWKEKRSPCVVFEITSRSTRLEDLGTKRALYEMLGVQEYYLFDPLDEYLRPRLQGYKLIGGTYHPLKLATDGSLMSRELNLVLRPEGKLLRVVDPATGEPLPTLDEAVRLMDKALETARTESSRAQVEAQRAETEAQRAETEAQRAETEAQRAETEAQRAEAETRRAKAEAQRASAAEARSGELEAEIERLRRLLDELR